MQLCPGPLEKVSTRAAYISSQRVSSELRVKSLRLSPSPCVAESV
jgi:hypothetical protein